VYYNGKWQDAISATIQSIDLIANYIKYLVAGNNTSLSLNGSTNVLTCRSNANVHPALKFTAPRKGTFKFKLTAADRAVTYTHNGTSNITINSIYSLKVEANEVITIQTSGSTNTGAYFMSDYMMFI